MKTTILLLMLFLIKKTLQEDKQNQSIPNGQSIYESTIPWPAYFWEIKPYIFTNEKGRLAGMIVDYFEEQRRVGMSCFNNVSNSYLIKYSNKLPDRESILQFYNNQSVEGYFLPIFGNNSEYDSNSEIYAPISATSVSLVAKQVEVELSNKLVKAVIDSALLGIVVVLISITFSFVYALIDQIGKEKTKTFMEELYLAISFCVTTMSTVGYGDMVPSNQISRLIIVQWMVFGLIISSLITGSITKFVYTDHDYLPPYRDKNIQIAVLNNSAEYKIATKDFFADKVTNYSTYEEIFDAIREGKSKYAIVNSDIAAYAQDTWNIGKSPAERLVVIFTKPIMIPIQIGYRSSKYSMSDKLAVCVDYYDGQAKEYAYARYRKRVKTTELYIPTMAEFILCYDIPRAMLIACCTLISLGILFDLTRYYLKRQRQKRSDKIEINETVDPDDDEDGVVENYFVDVPKADWSNLKNEIDALNKTISTMLHQQNKGVVEETTTNATQFAIRNVAFSLSENNS
ncbi:uncharacterized protein [Clytia hemisphaerica]